MPIIVKENSFGNEISDFGYVVLGWQDKYFAEKNNFRSEEKLIKESCKVR